MTAGWLVITPRELVYVGRAQELAPREDNFAFAQMHESNLSARGPCVNRAGDATAAKRTMRKMEESIFTLVAI